MIFNEPLYVMIIFTDRYLCDEDCNDPYLCDDFSGIKLYCDALKPFGQRVAQLSITLFTFIFQLRDYPCNITHNIFF